MKMEQPNVMSSEQMSVAWGELRKSWTGKNGGHFQQKRPPDNRYISIKASLRSMFL